MAQLMPLPLTVSCFSKIQIGFTFLVPAHPDNPGQGAVKRVCVCVCVQHWTESEGREQLYSQLMTVSVMSGNLRAKRSWRAGLTFGDGLPLAAWSCQSNTAVHNTLRPP